MENKSKIILGSFIGVFVIILGSVLVIGENQFIFNLTPNFLKGFLSAQSSFDNVTIDYKDDNMTIEFKDGEIILGQATLKSHKTYDEILEMTSGKNKIVIWYEFDFNESYKDILGEVEFIDMREFIINNSKEYKEFEESKIIKNPNYLKLVEKNYSFIYLNNEEWISYNSFDVPKENIIIGVQTDLFWGEFIDVRLNVFDNKLERHSIVLGTNAGFVTTSPVDDPAGSANSVIDTYAFACKDDVPVGYTKVTEIGWWCDTATEETNYEVGIFTHNAGDGNPEAVVGTLSQTNAKGTTAGWKVVTGLNIPVTAGTTYWVAVQVDNTATATKSDYSFSVAGTGWDKTSKSTLSDPWGVSDNVYTRKPSIYAKVEVDAGEDTCTAPASGIWEVDCNDNCTIISDVDIGTNSIILAGTGSFTILANISAGLIAIGPNCELLNVPGDGKELRIKGG